MSRGLGKVQQAVLSKLNTSGGAAFVGAIAQSIYDKPGDPPRAFVESVYRAVRVMARNGLVNCGHVHTCWRSCGYVGGAYCWLPGQDAPEARSHVSGKDVEQAIIDLLRQNYKGMYGGDYWPTSMIVRSISKQLGARSIGMTDEGLRVAVYRALHRMIERNILEPGSVDHTRHMVFKPERTSGGRFNWVRSTPYLLTVVL